MSELIAATIGALVGFCVAWVWQAQRAFDIAYWALKNSITPPQRSGRPTVQRYGGNGLPDMPEAPAASNPKEFERMAKINEDQRKRVERDINRRGYYD